MARIDYSKWDNLDEYSDDDNDNNIDEDDAGSSCSSSMIPRVTRLDEPSKITFGGRSENSSSTTPINIESMTTESMIKDNGKESRNETNGVNTVCNNSSSTSSQPASWTERGGLVVSESTTIDGKVAQKRILCWSQDRYSVTLRLELHEQGNRKEEEKIHLVNVEGILPFSDRFCATGSTRPVVRCEGIITTEKKIVEANNNKTNDSLVLLEGELPHPVHFEEDDDNVDWSISRDNSNRRFLMITLYKAVPMHGLSVWWRRPTMNFPELDLEQVKDQTTTGATSGTASATSSQNFLKSWEEAHKMFREEKKEKIMIP